MDYKYLSTFTAVAKVVSPSEQDRFVAKASLEPLKGLLPADVNPADSPDLLFISCNGAVAGLKNRNDDCISCETALAIHETARNKYITTDHDREKAVGVVLYPGLSTFGANIPLTNEAAAALKEPFNMAFVGVLWRTINPMLSKYIANHGAIGEDALSMSWEIAFNDYSIGVGSQNLFDAKIINADDPNFAAYDAYLRVNKGEGKDPSGNEVFRVIGPGSLILGYSVVPNPAAHVKGIIPLEPAPEVNEADVVENPDNAASNLSQIPDSQRAFLEGLVDSSMGFHLCDITMEDGQIHERIPVMACRYIPKGIDGTKVVSVKISEKSEEKNITHANASVTPNTDNPMPKITNLSELETALAKHEAVAEVTSFVKAIQQGSEDYVKKIEAAENLVKSAEAARLESEKLAQKTQASLDLIKAELDQVKAQAAEAEATQKFQERMAAFDEAFDLDAEDTKIIASDIKDLDDASFAAYMSKSKKLMAAKAKKKAADKADDDQDDDDKKDKKDAKAAADKLIEKAMASIIANKGETTVRSTVEVDQTMVEAMGEAFGESFKINGKSVKSKK